MVDPCGVLMNSVESKGGHETVALVVAVTVGPCLEIHRCLLFLLYQEKNPFEEVDIFKQLKLPSK